MVRATFAGFTTALTSLQANQARLNIVGQNLSNMNTEGYTRQQLDTSSLNYTNPTNFYMNSNDVNIGFGVAMTGTSQLRDQFLDVQYRTQNSKVGYNDGVDEGLTALSEYMDETTFSGLRDSFDTIQADLTNMQDASKVNDPVYEGQLRSDMEATTTLFNSTAESIKNAEINEVRNITGEGSNENGQVQVINDYLKRIGELNDQIKRNELVGNDVLELKDQRNLYIDKLSEYVPIRVTYYNTKDATSSDPVDDPVSKELNDNWPDDLKLELVVTKTSADNAVSTEYLTLVNGSNIGENRKNPQLNYGQVSTLDTKTGDHYNISTGTPSDLALVFEAAKNSADYADTKTRSITTDDVATKENRSTVRLGGKVQASLDMLATAESSQYNGSTYASYDYYMNRLDQLASTFAYNMNGFNYQGVTGDYNDANIPAYDQMKDTSTASYLLLVNDGSGGSNAQDGIGIKASNISISKNWVSGTTKIGTKANVKEENSATDNVLNMLQSMTTSYDYSAHGKSTYANGKRSYADEMNSISTHLANDKNLNARATDTNQTVLKSIAKSKDQISGVSLDEEATNMMTYVSAYSAAAKLMTALDNTLQTLLGIAG